MPRANEDIMIVSLTRGRIVVICLLLVGTAIRAAAGQVAAPGHQSTTFELTAGVVVDGADSRAYLMRPRGGVEAISLDDGRPLWSTDAADKPLWVRDGRLLAQRDPGHRLGVLPLVVLDVRPGGEDARRLEAPLPEQVSSAIQQGLQSAFETSVRPYGDGALVTWEFTRRKVGGAVPPEGREPPIERWEGAFEVDLEAAAVVEVDLEDVRDAEVDPLPGDLGGRVESGELTPMPRRAGSLLARVVEVRAPNGDHSLVLERWRAADGDKLPRIVLLDGRPVAHLVSADGRHVSVCTVVEGGAWDRYVLTIHSLETGDTVGSLRSFTSVTPFCVHGELLIHLSQPHGRRVGDEWIERPLELRAVAISGGDERWSRPLRDPRYPGPAPPGP
jgi:hypothetical protein